MTTQILNSNKFAAAELLLTFPAAIFIFVSVLKFQSGIPAFYDGITSVLHNAGFQNSPEWILNFFVIGCPLVALLLNVSAILTFNYEILKTEMRFHFSVKRKSFSPGIIILSAVCLLTLFMYLFLENCNCH